MVKTFSLRKHNGQLYFDVVREVPAGAWGRTGVPVLALDLGLRNFIASSEGDLRGEGFIQQLKRYDKQLQATTRSLQQAGIRRLAECSRYRRLVGRIRKFIKNSGPRRSISFEVLSPNRASKLMPRVPSRGKIPALSRKLSMNRS